MQLVELFGVALPVGAGGKITTHLDCQCKVTNPETLKPLTGRGVYQKTLPSQTSFQTKNYKRNKEAFCQEDNQQTQELLEVHRICRFNTRGTRNYGAIEKCVEVSTLESSNNSKRE